MNSWLTQQGIEHSEIYEIPKACFDLLDKQAFASCLGSFSGSVKLPAINGDVIVSMPLSHCENFLKDFGALTISKSIEQSAMQAMPQSSSFNQAFIEKSLCPVTLGQIEQQWKTNPKSKLISTLINMREIKYENSNTISGPVQAVDDFCRQLEEQKVLKVQYRQVRLPSHLYDQACDNVSSLKDENSFEWSNNIFKLYGNNYRNLRMTLCLKALGFDAIVQETDQGIGQGYIYIKQDQLSGLKEIVIITPPYNAQEYNSLLPKPVSFENLKKIAVSSDVYGKTTNIKNEINKLSSSKNDSKKGILYSYLLVVCAAILSSLTAYLINASFVTVVISGVLGAGLVITFGLIQYAVTGHFLFTRLKNNLETDQSSNNGKSSDLNSGSNVDTNEVYNVSQLAKDQSLICKNN